jgi:hypothetical protein
MVFAPAAASATAPRDGIRLSGRVMSQLGLAEQLVVWAFREVAGAAVPGSAERLACGFRLAFGVERAGAAACGFDGMRRCFAAEPERAPRFCTLDCACLAIDEERVLHALAAAQIGDRARHLGLMRPHLGETARLAFWRQCRLFALALNHAGLVLPDGRLAALGHEASRH